MSLWEQSHLTTGVDPSKAASKKTKRTTLLVVSVLLVILAVLVWLVSR